MLRIAVLDKASQRGQGWDLYFGGRRVPVKDSEPLPTILPNGTEALCYFVDFEAMPPPMRDHLLRCMAQAQPAVRRMAEQGIYPIIADEVTIVESEMSLWAMQPPG